MPERDLGAKPVRNQRIVDLHLDGATLSEIAGEVGLSRERVRVIIRRAGITPERSARIRAERLARERAERERAERDAEPEGPPASLQRYTDDDLLEHLREVAGRLGHTPRQMDLERVPGPHWQTYYNRFGTLEAAAKLAGLTPNKPFERNPVPDGFTP